MSLGSVLKKAKNVVTHAADPLANLASGNIGKAVDPLTGLGGSTGQSLEDAGGSIASGTKQAEKGISSSVQSARGEDHNNSSAQAAAASAQMKSNEDTQYDQNQGYNSKLGSADDAYLAAYGRNANNYMTSQNQLQSEIQDSQTDARNTYSGTIQPRLQNLMENAHTNSLSAMSLSDAMDPNNAVASATRKLYNDQANSQNQAYQTEAANTRDQYNQQGTSVQNQYNQQAQNEGKAGLASAGVLGALGMQNMAGQLGNIPMTGGQLQALMGTNQAQAGSAYAQTQQRLNSLRDQGVQGNLALQQSGLDNATSQRQTGLGRASDLQSQGLSAGSNASTTAYNQGQQATQNYGQSVANVESASDRQAARDTDYRNQRGAISGTNYGVSQNLADTTRGVSQAGTLRDMATYNTHMGGQQANIAGDIAGINAKQTANAQQVTGALQAGGTAAGAYFGGAQGAAAGNAAAQQIGNAAAPQPYQTPQTANYGSYGYGSPQNQNPSMQQQQMGIGAYQNANGLSLAGNQMPAQPGPTGGQFQANPYAYQQPQQGLQASRGGRSQGSRRAS